jgi:hypothetical protein
MERIYHRYELWECYKAGFFKNISGTQKDILSKKVLDLFNDNELTKDYMLKVINNWIYSSQHNLTNISLNRVAWLGQAACCVYAGIPYSITMENWRFVDTENQKTACDIAEKIIIEFENNNKQLCLNII